MIPYTSVARGSLQDRCIYSRRTTHRSATCCNAVHHVATRCTTLQRSANAAQTRVPCRVHGWALSDTLPTLTHAHACPHTHTVTHTRTHVYAHTHTRARAHTHTHAHTQRRSHLPQEVDEEPRIAADELVGRMKARSGPALPTPPVAGGGAAQQSARSRCAPAADSACGLLCSSRCVSTVTGPQDGTCRGRAGAAEYRNLARPTCLAPNLN